jgi:hypothetical protein
VAVAAFPNLGDVLKLGGSAYYYIMHNTTITTAFKFSLKAEYHSSATATTIATNEANLQT